MKLEYCNSCGSRFKIIYKAAESQKIYMTKEGVVAIKYRKIFWKSGKIIPDKIWIRRYQDFVKNLNEEYKEKFKEKIRLLFKKYFICPDPDCAIEIEDQYWRNEERIRMTSFIV